MNEKLDCPLQQLVHYEWSPRHTLYSVIAGGQTYRPSDVITLRHLQTHEALATLSFKPHLADDHLGEMHVILQRCDGSRYMGALPPVVLTLQDKNTGLLVERRIQLCLDVTPCEPCMGWAAAWALNECAKALLSDVCCTVAGPTGRALWS
jgi:hypothetical protein